MRRMTIVPRMTMSKAGSYSPIEECAMGLVSQVARSRPSDETAQGSAFMDGGFVVVQSRGHCITVGRVVKEGAFRSSLTDVIHRANCCRDLRPPAHPSPSPVR
jgi:hypothetical protein